jgi:hypothetical protein
MQLTARCMEGGHTQHGPTSGLQQVAPGHAAAAVLVVVMLVVVLLLLLLLCCWCWAAATAAGAMPALALWQNAGTACCSGCCCQPT